MAGYIVTNFAYGTGPYLRTTDLALAFNRELEKAGMERLRIIVPWVYGERQKRVLFEEFYEQEETYPGEILLDPYLGKLLRSVFYGEHQSYEKSLAHWVQNWEKVSRDAHEHLGKKFEASTITGQKYTVDGRDIRVELARAPRLFYNRAPSYSTTFAHISRVLDKVSTVSRENIAVDRVLAKKGSQVAEHIEKKQRMHAVAYPGTFSEKPYEKTYKDEILVPPVAPLPKDSGEKLGRGIYVTTTGIPGLEALYRDAKRLGIRLYSNDTKTVPGSVFATPYVISSENIFLQFARSGWSSVWISMITETPILMPAFDRDDDPEIYFNNRTVEALGLGVEYRGEPLEEILERVPRLKHNCHALTARVKKRWGTLDGHTYAAKLFVKDFLKR
jgi:hypothetical protein